MANPYSRIGCAPLWSVIMVVSWGLGSGVRRGVGAHDSPGFGLVWGGSTPGPPNPTLEGRLDHSGLSPEAFGWVTPDYAAGLRDSGYQNWLGRGWGRWWGSYSDPEYDAQYENWSHQHNWCYGSEWEGDGHV